MSNTFISEKDIAQEARARSNRVYWRMVSVFAILVVLFFVPDLVKLYPQQFIKADMYRALAAYDVAFVEKYYGSQSDEAPSEEEFLEMEKVTKSGKLPEFFENEMRGVTNEYKVGRREVKAPFTKQLAVYSLLKAVASILMCTFVIGPVNAGFAKTILDIKEIDVFDPKAEANSTSFILGIKDIFTFAFKEKRYLKIIATNFLYYGFAYSGAILVALRDIVDFPYSTYVGLIVACVGMWFAVFEFTFMDYILADRPDLSPVQVLKMSRRLIKGNKSSLLELAARFPLWLLLIIVSSGLGIIFFGPVYRFAIGTLYEHLRDAENKLCE